MRESLWAAHHSVLFVKKLCGDLYVRLNLKGEVQLPVIVHYFPGGLFKTYSYGRSYKYAGKHTGICWSMRKKSMATLKKFRYSLACKSLSWITVYTYWLLPPKNCELPKSLFVAYLQFFENCKLLS